MKKAWETEKSPNQRAGVAKHGTPPVMQSVRPEKPVTVAEGSVFRWRKKLRLLAV
jgi:hypothetical protein